VTAQDSAHPTSTRGRLEAFSDGVFAIAITLLVLDIAVPAEDSEDFLRAVVDQWPFYLAYVISFASIGAVWLAHQMITQYLDRVDAWFIRLNLLLLSVVSFLPFPTRLVGEHIGDTNPERVAVTMYGFTLLSAFALVSILWRYAVHGRLVVTDASEQDVDLLTNRLTPGMGAYVAMIALGLFFPSVAVVGYLAIAVFFIVPFGLILRHFRR
jgi:uncharacterized membrane protein